MESYIVRIYRREKGRMDKLLGLVEMAGRKEKVAFTDYDGLWEILCSPGERHPPEGKRAGRKGEGARQPPAPAPSARARKGTRSQ